MMSPEQIWQAALGQMEINLTKANFTTWFKHTALTALEDGRAIISVPNAFTKAWFERKYHKNLLQTLSQLAGTQIKEVVYQVGKPVLSATAPRAEFVPGVHQSLSATPAVNGAASTEAGLNPRYTFSNFVVGKSNELAHAAARAVAAKPGEAYNPLVLYGGVGLGKTHLVHAIGNEILARDPSKKVLYVTCETFTSEFVHAVRSGQGKKFKDTYRQVDVLFIDDVQFITGKDGTQEELFHTFNALHGVNRQVVVTSDRHPKSIPALEPRLLSRFEWGMIADISLPDFETRTAILEAKCQEKQYQLDPQIVNFVATVVQHNVRELEGALNKIIAFHQLKNQPPTLDFVKKILASSQPLRKPTTPKQITQTVSLYFDIPTDELMGKSREKRLSFPRQIIMYLMREELKSSYPAIGTEMGGRDHTTAMHACGKIERQAGEDPKLKQDIELIKQRLYNG